LINLFFIRAFYGEKISVSALLNGEYPPPKGAEPLYRAIHDVLTPSSPYGAPHTAGAGVIGGAPMMYSSKSAKETNFNSNNGYIPPTGNTKEFVSLVFFLLFAKYPLT